MAATVFRHSFDGTERPTNVQLPRMTRMSLPLPGTLRALQDTASQTSSHHQMIKERMNALYDMNALWCRDADLTRHIIKVFRQTPKLGGHHGAQVGLRREARPVPVGSAQNSRAMASFLAPLTPLRGAPGFVSRAASPAAEHRPWSGMMPPQQSTESTARSEQHHFARPPSSQTHWTLSHVDSIESRQMRQQLQPPSTPTRTGTGVLAVTTATPTNSLTTKLSGSKGTTFATAKDRGSVSPRRAEPTNQTNQSAMTPATPSMPTPPSAPRNQSPRGKHACRGRDGRGRDRTVQVYQVVG